MEWFNPQWTWDQMSSVLITVIFGGLLTGLIASVRKLTKEIKKFINRQDVIDEAVRNIIKTLIVVIHDDASERGYIGRYKLEVSERLFSSYEQLEGNSYVNDLMEDLRKLPHGKRKRSNNKKKGNK